MQVAPVAAWGDGQWYLPGEAPIADKLAGWEPRLGVGELLDGARRYGIAQVWIPHDLAETLRWRPTGGWRLRLAGEPVPGWAWAADGVSAAVEVGVLPADPRRSPWPADPARLVEELAAFEAALGARWHLSGAVTSDRWLRAYYRAPGGLRLAHSETVDVGIRLPVTHWARPAGRRDSGGYLHAWDVNAMYLAPASSLALPVGPATRLRPPIDPAKNPPPGYWRLDHEGWVTTPTLVYARERGDTLTVTDAVIWPEHHRWLEPWYRAIRDARHTLPRGGPAHRALKEMYTAGIGRLGSMRRSGGAADPLYQPYWRHAIMAEADARFRRKIAAATERSGRTPIAVDTDCAWYIHPSPNPTTAAAELGLVVSDQVGHFKHVGCQPYTPAVREALQGSTHTAIRQLRGSKWG